MIQKIKNIYHLIVVILANVLFLFPGRRLTVIGITGTDGKTTAANIIYHILTSSGEKAAIISSLGAVIDKKKYDIGFHVTTPSPFSLQKYLWRAKRKGARYFIIEVTSHAIDQKRIFGIPFKIGVLTNVTYEHLDYHRTFDAYFKTKTKLLRDAQVAVVNRDDGTYTFLVDAQRLKDPKNWITYGLSDNSDINPNTFSFKTKLLGDFNKYNVLAAVSVCKYLGVQDEKIRHAVSEYINPIGRADIVYNKEFSVIIDFAHTPNAFDQILKAVRPLFKGRLIHVFGSAGKRDTHKRPMMGEISSQYADIMILTAEDPRGEDVGKINDEIASGVKERKSQIIKIPDREEAIIAAIKMSKKGDVVLITGKAHEKSINYFGKEEPWDEYQTVEKALSTRPKK